MTARFSDFPVLYLEDEILVSLDVQQTIEEIGVDDLTAINTYEAASRAIESREFALAVLDINLGNGRSSFDLARELRRKGTEVIFTTGYNAGELPVEFEDFVVLEKPVVASELHNAVNSAYSRHEDA